MREADLELRDRSVRASRITLQPETVNLLSSWKTNWRIARIAGGQGQGYRVSDDFRNWQRVEYTASNVILSGQM